MKLMKNQPLSMRRLISRLLLPVLCLLLWTVGPAKAATPVMPSELKPDADGKMLLIDFYSPYCGACRMMEPHIEALKTKVGDKVAFKRIDLTKPGNEKYTKLYNIEGTPTYVLYAADGTPVYRMEETISPTILNLQVMRSLGQLKRVSIPTTLNLPAAQAKPEKPMRDMILLAFETENCKPCQEMAPYLSGFEMAEQEGLSILHLDTKAPDAKQLMESMSIKSAPAYVILDNTTAEGDARGELFRMEGEIKPRVLWDVIKIFSQPGV